MRKFMLKNFDYAAKSHITIFQKATKLHVRIAFVVGPIRPSIRNIWFVLNFCVLACTIYKIIKKVLFKDRKWTFFQSRKHFIELFLAGCLSIGLLYEDSNFDPALHLIDQLWV